MYLKHPVIFLVTFQKKKKNLKERKLKQKKGKNRKENKGENKNTSVAKSVMLVKLLNEG